MIDQDGLIALLARWRWQDHCQPDCYLWGWQVVAVGHLHLTATYTRSASPSATTSSHREVRDGVSMVHHIPAHCLRAADLGHYSPASETPPMTSQEERAREVLARRADAEGLAGRAEWLRAGCPVRADRWPSDDEAERVKVAAQVADMLALAAEVREEGSAVVDALGNILEHFADREQAPGHSHDLPGIWDRDRSNGDKGGTACDWCAKWENAKRVHAAAIRARGGERG